MMKMSDVFFHNSKHFWTWFLKNGNFFYNFYLQKFAIFEAHNSLKPKFYFFTNIFFHYLNIHPFRKKKIGIWNFSKSKFFIYFEACTFFVKVENKYFFHMCFFHDSSYFLNFLSILKNLFLNFSKKCLSKKPITFFGKVEKSWKIIMLSHEKSWFSILK